MHAFTLLTHEYFKSLRYLIMIIILLSNLFAEIKEKHRNEPFLKEYFGYTSFRPLQWEIISALVNFKRDVCAVLAPGYGRALCYQYPAVLHREKPVLVVSPLVDKVKEEMKSLVVLQDKIRTVAVVRFFVLDYKCTDLFPSFLRRLHSRRRKNIKWRLLDYIHDAYVYF